MMKSKNQKRRMQRKQGISSPLLSNVGNTISIQPTSSKFTEKLERITSSEDLKPILKRFKTKSYTGNECRTNIYYDNCESSKVIPSKKQLKQQQKPLLSDLKKLTNSPAIIEWFDADAPHPRFLVKVKTMPNIVQVPPNWRLRSEVPQFTGIQKYELPENVKDTGITEQRQLSSEAHRLDVNYDKLYDAFFSNHGCLLAEPNNLLRFGQVAELQNKSKYLKPQIGFGKINSRPSRISPKLLKALNVTPEGKLPWEDAISKFGLSPSYMKEEKFIHWGDP